MIAFRPHQLSKEQNYCTPTRAYISFPGGSLSCTSLNSYRFLGNTKVSPLKSLVVPRISERAPVCLLGLVLPRNTHASVTFGLHNPAGRGQKHGRASRPNTVIQRSKRLGLQAAWLRGARPSASIWRALRAVDGLAGGCAQGAQIALSCKRTGCSLAKRCDYIRRADVR